MQVAEMVVLIASKLNNTMLEKRRQKKSQPKNLSSVSSSGCKYICVSFMHICIKNEIIREKITSFSSIDH